MASCGRWRIPAAAASSAGAGISTASCSTSATPSSTRSPSPSTSWRTAGRRRSESPSAAAAPAGCWSARASRCDPSCSPRVVAEVPFVDVVTTMYDETLPLTITEWDEWGNPADEPLASYMLSYSPYDQTTARRLPGAVHHRRPQRPAGELPRAGQVDRQAARGAHQRCAADHADARWAPATPDRAVATTLWRDEARTSGVPDHASSDHPACHAPVRRSPVRGRASRRCARRCPNRWAWSTGRRSTRTAAAGPGAGAPRASVVKADQQQRRATSGNRSPGDLGDQAGPRSASSTNGHHGGHGPRDAETRLIAARHSLRCGRP